MSGAPKFTPMRHLIVYPVITNLCRAPLEDKSSLLEELLPRASGGVATPPACAPPPASCSSTPDKPVQAAASQTEVWMARAAALTRSLQLELVAKKIDEVGPRSGLGQDSLA